MELITAALLAAVVFSLILVGLRSAKVIISELSGKPPRRDRKAMLVAAAFLLTAVVGLAIVVAIAR